VAALCIEAEVHHVAFLDDVILAFKAHLTRFLGAALAVEFDKVLKANGLGADETFLEIAVDDACRLRGGPAFFDGPGARFLRAHGEIGLQAEEIVAGVDEAGEAWFFEADCGEEFRLFLIRERGDFCFQLR
jgi:hypothetical protein